VETIEIVTGIVLFVGAALAIGQYDYRKKYGTQEDQQKDKEAVLLKRIEKLEKKVEVLQSERVAVLAGKNNE